jgi:NTE family protein
MIYMENTNIEQAKQILANKSALCFEGGGVLGIGHVGALTRLNELGGLNNITHVVGTSVGSILAAAIGCKASVEYIQTEMFGLNMLSFKDTSKCIVTDLVRFFTKYGWYKEDRVEEFAGNMMFALTGNSDITLLDAYNKFGIKLTIVYLSMNYSKTKYANYITQPNLKIKHAIRRSASIPAFYQAVWDKRPKMSPEVFVDGGMTDNYPLHVLKEQGCPLKDILGFKLCSTATYNEYKEDMGQQVDDVDEGAPKGIYEHISRLITIVHLQALRYHVDKIDWDVTVKINIGTLTTTNFGITEDQKMMLFNNGRDAIDNHINEIAEMLSNGTYPLNS